MYKISRVKICCFCHIFYLVDVVEVLKFIHNSCTEHAELIHILYKRVFHMALSKWKIHL